VSLHVEVAPDVSIAQGDDDRLRLLFFNLMENAVKFNEVGGCVTVGARGDGAFVEVQVTNSHGTIAPELVPRLLQPFTQGDMGLSRPAGGLGLGLAVVRAIVDAHAGQLGLEAGRQGGTTARVRLPSVRNDI
jgi:signal transduction histidine kinase